MGGPLQPLCSTATLTSVFRGAKVYNIPQSNGKSRPRSLKVGQMLQHSSSAQANLFLSVC